MNWSSPKKKRSNASPEPTLNDRTVRCDVCFVCKGVYGIPDVGTPMVEEILRIKRPGAANQDIAKVIRCGQPGCTKRPVIIPFKGFAAHGIQLAHLERLVRACRGMLTFTMEELQEGQMRQHVPPPEIEAAQAAPARPVFGQDYDPNAHIEPRQQTLVPEVPL